MAIIAGWLSAAPPTGSSPNGSLPYFAPPGGGQYLNAIVNPSGLMPGTYTGTVTVYGYSIDVILLICGVGNRA